MRSAWELLAHYWPDVVLALVFAAIADCFRIGSFIRAGLRHFQDWMAEQSISDLRTRIQNQERYRDRMESTLTSDKGLYLHTLSLVLMALLLMCVTVFILLLERMSLLPGATAGLFALISLAFAIILCAHGLRLTSLDTRPKVEALLSKLAAEIAEMKAKLDGKTK